MAVAQHDVERPALQHAQRLLAAARGLDLVALLDEHALDQLSEVALIVDGQDAPLGHVLPRGCTRPNRQRLAA